MGISPRVVTEDRLFSWDGVTQRLPKGQVMDVPPDSALERAIGRQYLVPLPGTAPPQVPVPEAAVSAADGGGGGGHASAPEVAPVSPPRSRAVGQKQDNDAKDGIS